MRNKQCILINIKDATFDQFINPSTNNEDPKCIYLGCVKFIELSTWETSLIFF
jgi:hypothetical protein